jgi:hypothetical protein
LPVAREATNSSAAAAATTSLGGGATLTATRLTGGKTAADGRPLQRQTSANAAANDLLNTDKLVSQSGWRMLYRTVCSYHIGYGKMSTFCRK